jgi:hypothetical protein
MRAFPLLYRILDFSYREKKKKKHHTIRDVRSFQEVGWISIHGASYC